MLSSTCPCGVKQVSNGDCLEWRTKFFSGWYNQCLVFREAIICNDGVKQGVYFDNYGVTNKNFLQLVQCPVFGKKKIYTKRLLLLAPTCHSFDCIPPNVAATISCEFILGMPSISSTGVIGLYLRPQNTQNRISVDKQTCNLAKSLADKGGSSICRMFRVVETTGLMAGMTPVMPSRHAETWKSAADTSALDTPSC